MSAYGETRWDPPAEKRQGDPTSLPRVCPCHTLLQELCKKQQPFPNGIGNLQGTACLRGVCWRQEESLAGHQL